MKKALIILFILLPYSEILSQACVGHFTFLTQEAVDNFIIDNPDCTSITGNLTIGDNNSPYDMSDINDVSAFSNIISVGGKLIIRGNPNLMDLDGLEGIVTIGDQLWIIENDGLEDFAELNSLTSIGGDFDVSFNDNLVSVNGLQNVNSLGGDLTFNFNESLSDLTAFENIPSHIPHHLIIHYNDVLESLEGLENITSTGERFQIENNPVMTSLDGVENLTTVGGYFAIGYNDLLTDISALSNLTSIGSACRIHSNSVLENLNGLENLESLDGFLVIYYNDVLSNIDALSNLDPNTIEDSSSGDDLWLYSNPMLSNCAIESLCNFFEIAGKTWDVHGNATGCNNENQILEACAAPPCTILEYPLAGLTGVEINSGLSWEEADGAEGYILTVGTFPGGNDIMDAVDVGNILYYDPGNFPCNATIYVTINPYHFNGQAENCNEESFETEYVIAEVSDDVSICATESVELYASGGSNYSWTPEEGLDNPSSATPIASPEISTIYTVVVSNENGCFDAKEVQIIVYELPTPNVVYTNESMFEAEDGTASAEPTGGLAPYEFEWSNGETTQMITNLAPGYYEVTVTDANACSHFESFIIEAYFCDDFFLDFNQYDIACFGDCNGSIEIYEVENSVYPVTFEWSTGSNEDFLENLCVDDYYLTITDNNNCIENFWFVIEEPDPLYANISAINESGEDQNNGIAMSDPSGCTSPYSFLWSNGATTSQIENLSPGIYYLTLTDQNACEIVDSIEIETFECSFNSIAFNMMHNSCFEDCLGSIQIIDTSGASASGPIDYYWNNGEESPNIDNLCNGIYIVTVTDFANCQVIDSVEITSPSQLSLVFNVVDESNEDSNDGSILVIPEGGTPPYNFAWNNGKTTDLIEGLEPGEYHVTITDSMNCSMEGTAIVQEFLCQGFQVFTESIQASCYAHCDASIEIVNITGEAPFSFEWSTGNTSNKIDSLCSGSYFLTVTDNNLCSMVDSFIISWPEELSNEFEINHESSYMAENGNIDAFPDGGTPPYIYQWSTGDSTQLISNLPPGIYELTITDSNLCQLIDSSEILEYKCQSWTPEFQVTDISCYGDCDGVVNILNLDSLIQALQIEWSNGNNQAMNEQLCFGNHTVFITDSVNCTYYDSIFLSQPDEIVFTLDSIVPISNDSSGGIFISIPEDNHLVVTWEDSFGNIHTTEDLFSLSLDGTYYLTLYDTLTNCSLDTLFFVPLVDVNNLYESLNILLYPNPTTDKIILEIPDMKSDKVIFKIMDILSKNIEFSFREIEIGKYELMVNGSNGIHQLIIYLNGQLISKSFILME